MCGLVFHASFFLPTFNMFFSFITVPIFVAKIVAGPAFEVGQVVQTDSGPISGHAASQATNVSEYLGIPFAEPPVGNLRFAAPVRYQSTGQTINASEYTLACPANGTSGKVD